MKRWRLFANFLKGVVSPMREKGKVKWFNEKKGWGFIVSDSGDDIFAHYSEIQGDGFKTLKEDEPVEFEIVEKDKGLYAKNITRIPEEE